MIKKTLLSVVLAAVLASGCANQGSSSAEVDPALKESGAKFFSDSGIKSCLAGAGIGVLGCMLSNADTKLACAAIAGASGCAVGIATNYVFDNVRSNYATTEKQLDATKEMVVKDIDSVKGVNKAASDLIKRDTEAVAALEKKVAAGQADKKALQQKSSEMDANIAYIKEQVEGIDSKIESYKYARDQYQTSSTSAADKKKLSELDTKIASLKAERDNLYAISEDYTSQRNRLARG